MATTLLDRPHALVPVIDDDLTRRRLLSGIGVLGLTVTLAGCADDADGTRDAAAPASPDPTPSADAAGPFPVTIAHKFGETTIPAEPKRIVVAGLVEQDPLLALGIVPVAATEWFGDHPGAIHPWARDALGGAPLPQVLGGGNGSNYELEQAEELVAGIELRLREVQAAHPEFATSTGAYVDSYDASITAYTPADAGVVLTFFGFRSPPELAALTRPTGFFTISEERLDLLEADVLHVLTPTRKVHDELLGNELYTRLRVHTEGRAVVVVEEEDPELFGAASSFLGVLSFPVLIDRLVPRLAAALDGDPATPADPSTMPSTSATPTPGG